MATQAAPMGDQRKHAAKVSRNVKKTTENLIGYENT